VTTEGSTCPKYILKVLFIENSKLPRAQHPLELEKKHTFGIVISAKTHIETKRFERVNKC
jgi:hypothetical protein